MIYRYDIDGLRAYAVLFVFFYHCGILTKGYLGVDIFFVISGFLISKIIHQAYQKGTFSLWNFYKRRIRRIIPLVSFFSVIALPFGFLFMLADDFENLAQSVIASNLFSNNILQYITTANYWDIVNEYKPLMHTWSLGIEEQFYFFYPLLFLIFNKKWLLYVITSLTLISFVLYCSDSISAEAKFYLLPARFFELSLGGIAAIMVKKQIVSTALRNVSLLGIFILIFSTDTIIPSSSNIPLIILPTLGLLLSTPHSKRTISSFILENQFVVFLGKISFSIYMWHQFLLAFIRYTTLQELEYGHIALILMLCLMLSYLTYSIIEQPFRNKKNIAFKKVLVTCLLLIASTSLMSFYIYTKGGILKDFPTLEIKKSTGAIGIHKEYNDRIKAYDKSFSETKKIKVLVIGDSFGRDWINILLENPIAKDLIISYTPPYPLPIKKEVIKDRIHEADIVFWSRPLESELKAVQLDSIHLNKVWCVGTKNFGLNAGIFYNYRGTNFCAQRTVLEEGQIEINNKMKAKWKTKYIDLIKPLIDNQNTVPVFTENCKFISQDCRHLTKAGAKFYSNLLDHEINAILVPK